MRKSLGGWGTLLASATLAGSLWAAGPARLDPPLLARRVDAYCRPLEARGELSGTLLVAQGDRIVLERSWGMANRELRVPNTPETRQCIASITKPITVFLATILINEGKLRLDDTLSRWIPDFPRGDRITVTHLLTHRAGIPHRVTTDREETEPLTPAQVVEYVKKATPLAEPGEASYYSSAGYTVLTRVLELASGQSYPELLRTRIFERAGMTQTVHADATMLLDGRASSYVPTFEGVRNAPLKDNSFLAGAGSLYSTPRDLHRLIRALVAGRLGEPSRVAALRGGRIRWNGSTNGFRAFADYDSATDVTVVFAGNLHTGAPDLVHSAVADIVAGKDPGVARVPSPSPASVPLATLRSYEGIYLMENGTLLSVRASKTGLDANAWPLVATSDSTFFCLRDYGRVSIVLGADRRAVALDWDVLGRPQRIPRVGDLETTARP